LSREAWGSLRLAVSVVPAVAALLVPAVVASEAYRARQRALAWALEALVRAAVVSGADADAVGTLVAERATTTTSGSTMLTWWMSLSPLLPTPPTRRQAAVFVSRVVAIRGLRQPEVPRLALADLDAITADLGRNRTNHAAVEWQRLIVAVACLRGGARFRTAVNLAAGAWGAPPVFSSAAVLLTSAVEKADFESAAVRRPHILPLPCPGLREAVHWVGANSHAPAGPAAYGLWWGAISRPIRAFLRERGIADVRASRRELAERLDGSGPEGRLLAELALHHVPGSRHTVRYTTALAPARRVSRAIALALVTTQHGTH
jgi:hypothetical protein